MGKSLRDQMVDCGMVSISRAKAAERAAEAKFLDDLREQVSAYGNDRRVLADYGKVISDRRVARRDFADVVVEYRRHREMAS